MVLTLFLFKGVIVSLSHFFPLILKEVIQLDSPTFKHYIFDMEERE